ncbi:hypothetical protein GE061_017035 [Apolygus lucorum]|uniref:Uncharacterized protein n=1 Tax=Apolygus lucorum TaxID=248454 RepID=A0A8S9XHY0_APOLU|nr:hypothetical protein GE061_017035 [Apolygus lucorum]
MNEPGQHLGGVGEEEMSGVLGQLESAEIPVVGPSVVEPATEPDTKVLAPMPGVGASIVEPGAVMLVAEPDTGAPVPIPSVEVAVAGSDVEELVTTPGVGVPVVWQDGGTDVEGTDDCVGRPMIHFPSGDLGFRRIGAVSGENPGDGGGDAEEFPIERWDEEQLDARTALRAKLEHLEPDCRGRRDTRCHPPPVVALNVEVGRPPALQESPKTSRPQQEKIVHDEVARR